jgi:hypothetical protein
MRREPTGPDGAAVVVVVGTAFVVGVVLVGACVPSAVAALLLGPLVEHDARSSAPTAASAAQAPVHPRPLMPGG